MYPFNYIKEHDRNNNVHNLCLIEKNDTSDNHQYNFVFPEFIDKRDTRIWISLTMCNWMNTTGKTSTFKQITKQFEKICKDAEKLKI